MKTRLLFLAIGLLFTNMLSVAQQKDAFWGEGHASVQMDSIWGCPGEIVEVPVRLYGISELGLNSFTLFFQLDTSLVEPVLLEWDSDKKMGLPLFTGWDMEFFSRGMFVTNYFLAIQFYEHPNIAIAYANADPWGGPIKRPDGSVLFNLNLRIKKTPGSNDSVKLSRCGMAFGNGAYEFYDTRNAVAAAGGRILAKSSPQVKIEGKKVYPQTPALDMRMCKDDNLPLTASGAERYEWETYPTDFHHYTGEAKNYLDRTDVFNPLFMPRQPEEYFYKFLVRGYNSDGCMGVDSIYIYAPGNPNELNASDDYFIRIGDSIDLSMVFGYDNAYKDPFIPYQYQWFPAEKVKNVQDSATKTLAITEPTWFWGQATDRNGCVRTVNVKVDVYGDELFGFIEKSDSVFCGENGITRQTVALAALIKGGSDEKSYEWEFKKLYSGQEPQLSHANSKGTNLTFYGTTAISVRVRDEVTYNELLLTDTVFVEAAKPLSIQIAMDEASREQYEIGYCINMPITFEATVQNAGENPKIYWEVDGYRARDNENKTYYEGAKVTFPSAGNGYKFRAIVYASSEQCVDQQYVYSNEEDPKSEYYQITGITIDSSRNISSEDCNEDSVLLFFYAHNLGTNPFFEIYRNDELIDSFTYYGTDANVSRAVKSLNYWDRFSVKFTNTSCKCLINNNRVSNYWMPKLKTTKQLKVPTIVSDMGGDTICNSAGEVYAMRLTGMEQFGQNTTVIWMLNDKEWGRYEFDPTVSVALTNSPEKHQNLIINEQLNQDERVVFNEGYAFNINDEHFPKVGEILKNGDSLWAIVITHSKCSPEGIVIDTVLPVKPTFVNMVDANLAITSDADLVDLSVCKGGEITFDATFENAGNAWVTWYWNDKEVGSGLSYTLKNPKQGDSVVAVFESNFKCAGNLPARISSKAITILDLPKLIFQKDTAICNGTSVQLSVNSETPLAYTWNADATLSALNVQNPVAMPESDAVKTYIVTGKDNRGCESTDTLIVRTLRADTVKASIQLRMGDTLICKGQQVQLRQVYSPTSGVTRTWLRNGFETTDGANIMTSNLRDGDVYQLRVTYPNTCLAKTVVSEPMRFHVNPLIKTKIWYSDNKICNTDSIELAALGEGERSWTYHWTATTDPKVDGRTDETFYVKPDVTTKYVIEVFDEQELCSSKDSVTIEVQPYVEVTNKMELIGRDTTYCANADNTFVFEAQPVNGGLSPMFDWFINGVRDTQTMTPTYAVKLNGDDEIYCEVHASADIVTCGENFAQSLSMTIVELPIPEGEAFGDTTLCPGESTRLIANGGERYDWTPTAGLSSHTDAEITATPSQTTDYVVKILNEYDCFITDTVKVNVIKAPKPLTLQLTPELDSLCEGEIMTLNALASYSNTSTDYSGTIRWFVNGQERPETDTALVYVPEDGDLVYVTMKVDGVECLVENEKQSNVFVARTFSVYAQMPKRYDTICRYDTLFVSVETNGNLFQWDPVYAMTNSGNKPSVGIFISVSDAPFTSYLYAFDARIGNCHAKDTLYLTVRGLPAQPLVDDQTLCTESSVDLHVLSPLPDMRYLWYDSENLVTPIDTALVLPNCEEGYYAVRALAPDGCKSRTERFIEVIRGLVPNAKTRLLTQEVMAREPAEFENESSDWEKAFWSFAGAPAIEDNDLNVHHTFSNIGIFPVVLTVESVDGCRDDTLLQVQVLPQLSGVFVPTAFMPSAPNDEDKVLKVYGEDIISIQFSVYSLDGKELFSTQTRDQGWDGKSQGKDMPTGNYSYRVTAKLADGQEVVKSGTSTLIR